jgi:tetratricopeptide (TPR) repeat protein
MKNKQLTLSKEQLDSVYTLYSNSQFQAAIDKIKALNEEYPNVPLLFNLIGACYKELGNLEGSVKMFEVAVNIKPNYAEAHFNLGVVLTDLGRLDAAIESYNNAIKITPRYFDAHNNLGNAFQNQGKLEAAIESYEWALAYNPHLAEAHNNLGNALSEYGRIESAIKSYEKAVSIKPDYLKALFNLAMSYKDIGDKKGFLKSIEKVVNIKPDWGDPQLHLSRVKRYKKSDPKITEMQLFLNRADLDIDDRIALNFTLAHINENLEDHAEQFKFLNEANRLQRQELNYSSSIDFQRFDRIKEVFKHPPAIIKKTSASKSNIKPFFIVGMPRSGTSLVHQIIDSHSEVYGAGELNILNSSVTPILKGFKGWDKEGISQDDILSVNKKYLDSLNSFNLPENIIVDKMPLNFRYIGFILSAFPEAKIIHMKRDPMATCWSIYKYFFNGNAYSYDQEDLARYYLLYKDLMTFWSKKFPNKVYDICYEDLTTNQEKETRKLLKYCDLEWDENCLNFHTNHRAVKTTSALQVRQKIYQGSSEAWKKYEAYLQPLIKGLNYY